MEYLYDMGYLINRSMYRVLKNEMYLYEQGSTATYSEEEIRRLSETGRYTSEELDEFRNNHRYFRPYTQAELEDPELMAEEGFKDVMRFLKNEFNTRGLTDNNYIMCFDDKSFQLRPEYKNRQTPELNKEIKRRMQKKLLALPETKHFKKVVGYGMEADDWIYTLRIQNTKDGKQTCFHTCDCDLLCNIDQNTTGVFYKHSTSNEIDKDSWNEVIGSVFSSGIPYNVIWLYKTTVGDPSDSITGIRKFGPKAFEKLMTNIEQAGIPIHTLNNLKSFELFLHHENGLKRFITEEQYPQVLEAWKLVKPIPLEEAKQLFYEAQQEIADEAPLVYNITM